MLVAWAEECWDQVEDLLGKQAPVHFLSQGIFTSREDGQDIHFSLVVYVKTKRDDFLVTTQTTLEPFYPWNSFFP